MIRVTYIVEEHPDRTGVKWSDEWQSTVWNLDGTIVLVVGPGREPWQARCFTLVDDSGHFSTEDDNPDMWACSWFKGRGVRIA